MERTTPHGSEPLSPSVLVGKSAGIWRVVAGRMYARALVLEPVLLGRPERTNGSDVSSTVIPTGKLSVGIEQLCMQKSLLRCSISLTIRSISCF